MRTLLVDDDPAFRRLAAMALEDAGVDYVPASDSAEALELLEREVDVPFDLVLLDQELPGMKGQEVLRRLRQNGNDVPVVLVTVRDDRSEKIRALQAGADDYIVKPFEFPELLARVRAVVRRSRGARPIHVGSLKVDPLTRRVESGGRPVDLTPREFEILYVLARAQERTVSRQELLHRVWGVDHDPGTNFIQVHVSRLRAKLGEGERIRIQTVRGEGYRLVSGPSNGAASRPSHPSTPP